jgi:proteasome lid subunit RPN8/RPN11
VTGPLVGLPEAGVTLRHDVGGDEQLTDAARQEMAGAAPEGSSAVEAPSDLAVEIGTPVLARVNARLPATLLQELIDWARAGVPNEACGIIAGDRFAIDGGSPLRFHALTNKAASPYRYLIDPDEQLKVNTEIDDADEVVWGIFHSHVASPAEPSPTDLESASFTGPQGEHRGWFPGSLYLICSLSDPTRPVARAWALSDGGPAEVTLEIV